MSPPTKEKTFKKGTTAPQNKNNKHCPPRKRLIQIADKDGDMQATAEELENAREELANSRSPGEVNASERVCGIELLGGVEK